MRIHYLQHVPFEGLGSMEPFFLQQGHRLSSTHLYRGDRLPALADLDWLVIMGGPMGVHDLAEHPWLEVEKTFIRRAIDEEKIVLGVCLGAQLIAHALGSRVYKNPCREIGWFPLQRVRGADDTLLAETLPDRFPAYHWHGDTFDLPPGASLIASSEACINQAFVLNDRVLGFQFHLETTPASAAALVKDCADELDGSRFVQSAEEMLEDPARFQAINEIMASVLGRLISVTTQDDA